MNDDTKRVKVLHVVGAMNRAGTETMLMNVFRHIDREKVQFDFISYNNVDAHYDEEIYQLGGRVIQLSNSQSIKELVKAIKTYGPYDVVHSHTLFHCGVANVAARIAGVKVRIAHAHTTLDRSDRLLQKIYITSMRSIIKTFSTDLLACSHNAGRYLFGEKTVERPTYSYFPNVIDYSRFLQDRKKEVKIFKAEQGINEKNLVIGHIGRFIEAKNHRFLLAIMKQLVKKREDVNLLLVGDGDLKKEMEEEAKKQGIFEKIRFVGIREDIDTMLHCMDVFVFPSIYEGLGLVLLEAQASGVPCLVSEAIQPEADLNLHLMTKLTLKDSPGMWADTILSLADKKETNMSKVANAFEVSGYSLPAGLSKLMSIYQVN